MNITEIYLNCINIPHSFKFYVTDKPDVIYIAELIGKQYRVYKENNKEKGRMWEWFEVNSIIKNKDWTYICRI